MPPDGLPSGSPSDGTNAARGGTEGPRRKKHAWSWVLLCVVPVGVVIGCADVLYWEPVWPVVLATLLASFVLTLLMPTRWLGVAVTLSFLVWGAYAWVRVPWWPHPDEVGQNTYSVVIVAVCAFFGAMTGAALQRVRGRL